MKETNWLLNCITILLLGLGALLLVGCSKDTIEEELIMVDACADKVISVYHTTEGSYIVTSSGKYEVTRAVASEYHPDWAGYKKYYCNGS